ncbi:MAG: aminopeptidase [Clostridiales bacterium]|nr:aminopeptidase [Clostridiales bacterium]
MIATKELLEKYARLAVRTGINLQKGQKVIINAELACAEFARMCAKAAYEAGAAGVEMDWTDEESARLRYLNSTEEYLTTIPQWYVDKADYQDDQDFAYLYIDSDDPDAFAGVPAERIAMAQTARRKAIKRHGDNVSCNRVSWSIVALPTEKWAKKVFPGCTAEEAMDRLYDAIFKAVRLYEEDPVKAWEDHLAKLQERAKWLTEQKFDALRVTTGLGTDLTVGLADDHIWGLGGEERSNGAHQPFVANMPTEEVFTAPHNKKINGVVKSSMPLNYNGQLIDGMSFTFENGKVVDFDATLGKDVLSHLLDTDAGARSLGEVALVPCKSPIYESGIFFYNTLFDENASCHLALGSCYPTCIKNGAALTNEDVDALGGNDSAIHVDFMFGTDDLTVTGLRGDEEIPVFVKGNWA